MSFAVDERRAECVPSADVPDVLALSGLVWSIVDDVHFRSGTIEREDLFQIGMEAVVRSVGRYRADSNGSFSNFAAYRIRGAMWDHLRQERPGSRRNPQEHPMSLDMPIETPRGTEGTLADRVPSWDPEPLDPLLLVQLWALIDALPDVMSRAVRLCAEAELTMQDIAAIEGVTVSAISHRLTRARAILQPRIERLLEPTPSAERPPLPFIGFVEDSEWRLTRQRRFSPEGRRVARSRPSFSSSARQARSARDRTG